MLLRERKLTASEATEITKLLENMSSANIIVQFGTKLDNMNVTLNAKLDAHSAVLETKPDAVNAKLIVLIWEIGFATAILSAAMFLT